MIETNNTHYTNSVIQEDIKRNKKNRRKRKIRIVILIIVISFLLVLFGLKWQDSYTLLAYCNSFYLSAFMFFFFGWIVLMANKNILSPLIYGTKTFFLMFAGKKPKLDYYSYVQDKKDNPIPSVYFWIPFIAMIPNLAVAIVLHIIIEFA